MAIIDEASNDSTYAFTFDLEPGDIVTGNIGRADSFLSFDPVTGYVWDGDAVDVFNLHVVAGLYYTFTMTADDANFYSLEAYNLNSPTGDPMTMGIVPMDGQSTITFIYQAQTTGTLDFILTSNLPDPFIDPVTAYSTGRSYTLVFEGASTLPPPSFAVPTAGDDILTGTGGSDAIDLLGGADLFDAAGGSDYVLGGAGDDTIYGGSGKDTLYGGADDDLLDGGSGNDALYGGDGNDTLIGATGNDILHGDDGDDSLSGGAGADTLIGGAGNDTLDGGDGNDVLTGGTGADIFRLLSGRDTVTDFEDGVDRIDVTALNVSDISMLAVIQTVAGTRVVATGGAELFLAGITATDLSNDDFILSEPVIVVPTPGADIFNGTDANDHFAGGSGADLLYGGNGRDTLLGDSGEDTIYGGAQNDLIRGGSGDDQLFGEAGNDVIYGDSGNDKIEGGGGNDYIDGGADNDRLYGGAGHDTLIGEHGNDKLWGGSGDDLLFGGAGKDELYGGIGNDTLSGGLGDDILTGGAGADVFVFEDRMRADVVTDFELGIDRLDFSAFWFTGLAALTLTQIGANAEVRVSDRDYVTLQNINVADLTVDDFIFAPDPGFFVLT